jgi:MFS superfamily sulfate permease-like transporter
VPDVDLTAAQVVRELNDEVARRGATLWLAGLNSRPEESLRKSGQWDRLRDEGRVHGSVDAATARFRTA